jgi:hypothetical protein
VREYLGRRREDLREQLGPGVEVGRQELDAAVRDGAVDRVHRLGVQPGTAVGEVVAGDPVMVA